VATPVCTICRGHCYKWAWQVLPGHSVPKADIDDKRFDFPFSARRVLSR